MMTIVATGGLMATAQLAPMARDFGVDKTMVNVLGWTVIALPFALSLDRLVNGLCRPAWGWVSDHIGREKTMAMAFGLEAIAIFCLVSFAHRPLLFVIFSAFTFFGWGEIFSLFPALCGDFFGRKYATTNYGFLYTAKGTSSVLIPIGSALAAGKAFDFRADILLLSGALLVVFALFLAPTVFQINLGAAKGILLVVAGALVDLRSGSHRGAVGLDSLRREVPRAEGRMGRRVQDRHRLRRDRGGSGFLCSAQDEGSGQARRWYQHGGLEGSAQEQESSHSLPIREGSVLGEEREVPQGSRSRPTISGFVGRIGPAPAERLESTVHGGPAVVCRNLPSFSLVAPAFVAATSLALGSCAKEPRPTARH